MLALKKRLKSALVSEKLAQSVARIPKPVGSFGYDAWGYSSDTLMISLSLFSKLYTHYFRTQVSGIEHIPKTGRVLIVANHSGQIPLDGLLIGYAMATSKHGPRAARAMVERWIPTVPFLGNLLNELGAVIGDPVNCAKMLQQEEAVIVFPEGVRGSGKIFKDRYQLQPFGTGFMHIAIANRTPIVPVGVVGCEETLPSLMNIKTLARALGTPYFPMTLPFPLPAKVRLYFGKPMLFTGDQLDESSLRTQVERVSDCIRDLVEQGLGERGSWFW